MPPVRFAMHRTLAAFSRYSYCVRVTEDEPRNPIVRAFHCMRSPGGCVCRLHPEEGSNHAGSHRCVAFARLPHCAYEWAAVGAATIVRTIPASQECSGELRRSSHRSIGYAYIGQVLRPPRGCCATHLRSNGNVGRWCGMLHYRKGATLAKGVRSEQQLSQRDRLYLPHWECAAQSRTLGQRSGDLGRSEKVMLVYTIGVVEIWLASYDGAAE
jgi:hypothetical protein